MRANRLLRASVFAVLLTFFLLPAAAHATVCTAVVNGIPYSGINAALGAVGNGPVTITVTGTCTENVQINNGRSITIAAPTPGGDSVGGATVVGPLDADAFDIDLSQDINLVNLEITGTVSNTGNGGGAGVSITEGSLARIFGCNIHDNQGGGVGADTGSILILRHTMIQNNTPNDGLDVTDNSTADVLGTTIQNNGSGVFLTGSATILFRQTNLIQNNADFGIFVANLSHVRFQSGFAGRFTTVQGHNVNGISVTKQSFLGINGASPQVIQGNGSACPLDPTCGGIFVGANSTVQVNNGTISGNHGSGISAQRGANVILNGATVSNNTGDGVHIQWISIGDFIPGSGTTLTGNGGKSVFCDTTSLAVGDLSGFTNIGCNQIARSIGPPRPGRER